MANIIICSIVFSSFELGMSTHRQAFLQKLNHKFSLTSPQDQILFDLDIIHLIINSDKQLQAFRLNPSTYLIQIHTYFIQALKHHHPQTFQTLLKINKTKIFLKSIPYTEKLYLKLKNLSQADIGNWVVLSGTVVQALQSKTLEKSKVFACNQCGKQYRKENDYQNYYRFQMNTPCSNMVQKQKNNSLYQFFYKNINKRKQKSSNTPEQPKASMGKCNSYKFTPLDSQKICEDYQEIRIQQQFKHISAGKLPQTLTVIIEGNLGDVCRAGDDVVVSGMLGYRFKKPINDQKLNMQMIMIANTLSLQKSSLSKDNYEKESLADQSQLSISSIQHSTHQSPKQNITKEIQLRNSLINKFCPTIYGREIVKLGLILSLLGGVSFQNEHTKIRGQSHVLLVGQPGTGKSVLIKQAANLAQRSFFTNGIGTSSAGLSVSYYKDGADWTIQPGALVLADNGVCCIDELTLLSKKDEHSLLEAMEQQTISSAKASVVGKLNARTTVICACNPITSNQKYDASIDLQVNTGLSIPLLTRFDLIMILKDESERQQDVMKCDYILQKFLNEEYIHPPKQTNFSLKSYLKKCRLYQPELRGGELLSKYYIQQRKNTEKVTTARAFESLCRLSEAHAKLMMRDYTTELDCLSAIMLTQNQVCLSYDQYMEFANDFSIKYKLLLEG